MNKIRLFCICLLFCLITGCEATPFFSSSGVIKTKPVQRIILEPCIVGNTYAECGYLHVPEDRNHPNRRILDLKTVVVRAHGPDRQPDPLFFISGGPGSAVTEANNVDTSNYFTFSKVNLQRDLVFVDQRGVNDNHRLTCEPPLPSFSINDATQQQVDEWMTQCLANLDGDPRFYMTIPAMQDLDEAREALGYDKINLYGGSYGTKAVQVYTRMFPEHVRAAVTDHGNALDLPLFPTFAHSAQLALDQLFTYCELEEKCQAAFPDIRADFKAVFNRLENGPVVTSYIPTGETEPVRVAKINLETGIFQLMYDGNYGQIPSILHSLATNEDWTQVVKSNVEQHPGSDNAEPFLFMKGMIDCFDPAEAFGTGVTAAVDADSYYYDAFMDDAHNWQKICSALPKPDPSMVYGPGRPTPASMLMINSLLDPIFPPSSMDLALKEFTRSRVVVEPTEGHITPPQPECRWNIIAQYIQQGSVDGLDTSCLDNIKPSFVIEDE